MVYIAWAFSSDETLFSLGISYFPSRYWAVALPAFLVAIMLCVLPALFAVTLSLTRPLTSLDLVFDEHTKPPVEKVHPDALAPLYDIPLSVVNELMYDHAHTDSRAAWS
ncbi:uncharacterized protein AMSG_03815 [Thecamonas trahens ATCC 50062]|uniref:PIG-P domain-containing protein n=1 Tax=Thecamonas trahens ATCC 50062 TaxID=461836 RepID=A0A0L0D5L5_THETB|nr:hypothetical protein AMSG_03815 [Thecamonas trahens ATCC 50062]KNC47381.1 hypothetical protein AMSG_03815 [Thecamonas trahens ATCC 50062]|eukprot:XP_013759719.1 hypothetical protein AMSG_03815 [Thecamonas trahens ATCC 50062]